MNDNIKVSVIMVCYNHERYLKKAIESVINQITNFSYELIIHDDASTDNSAQIIRHYEKKYPNLIRAIYQTENKYQKHINMEREFIYPIVRGEYIAKCEGDDYWLSQEKLQKQVDILDCDKSLIACSHNCAIIDDNDNVKGNTYTVYHYCKTHIFKLWNYECGLFPGQTAALMFRKSALTFESKEQENSFYAIRCEGDQKLSLHLLLNGDIYYMEEVMSAHRVVRDKGDSWTARIRNKDMALYMFRASIDLRNYAKKYYGVVLHNHYVTFHRGVHILLRRIFGKSVIARKDYEEMVNECGSLYKALKKIVYMGVRSFPFFLIEKMQRNKNDIT